MGFVLESAGADMFGDTGTKVNNIIFYYTTTNPDLVVSIYLGKIRDDEDCHSGKGRRDDEYHIENEFHQFHLPKEVRKVVFDLLKNSKKEAKNSMKKP